MDNTDRYSAGVLDNPPPPLILQTAILKSLRTVAPLNIVKLHQSC